MLGQIKKDLLVFWNFGVRAIGVFFIAFFLSNQSPEMAFKFAGAYLALELGNYFGLFEKLKILSCVPNKKGQQRFLFMGAKRNGK